MTGPVPGHAEALTHGVLLPPAACAYMLCTHVQAWRGLGAHLDGAPDQHVDREHAGGDQAAEPQLGEPPLRCTARESLSSPPCACFYSLQQLLQDPVLAGKSRSAREPEHLIMRLLL